MTVGRSREADGKIGGAGPQDHPTVILVVDEILLGRMMSAIILSSSMPFRKPYPQISERVLSARWDGHSRTFKPPLVRRPSLCPHSAPPGQRSWRRLSRPARHGPSLSRSRATRRERQRPAHVLSTFKEHHLGLGLLWSIAGLLVVAIALGTSGSVYFGIGCLTVLASGFS